LENTWVIFTSDHGELFERGIVGHGTPVLYQPLVRVPLLIFEPGREVGAEIHDLTSVVDLLPTLAQITGHELPDWTEGVPLPPYATAPADPNRNVFAVQARENDNNAPLTRASIVLVKGRYKLHYYFGYRTPKVDQLAKLYDIEADPEELVDLSASQSDIAAELLQELKSRLAQANQPFQM
jgi:arylsulfatase A-like enzyme